MHLQGVILYEILSGSSPFFDDDDDKMQEQIKSGNFIFPPALFDHISEEAQDLIKNLLVLEPEERLSSEQILSHPWLQVIQANSL